MENLETITSKESSLTNELNEALQEFSASENTLKNEIITSNKDLKPRTKEEMTEYITSWECKQRIEKYIQVNGLPIIISQIAIDEASSLIQIQYTVTLGDNTQKITSYMQIMGEKNNTYIQFKKNPTTENDASSIEIWGSLYDIQISKSPSKGIDIRIVENPKKTQEKILETIKKFELTPTFTDNDFEDATLENTKITALKYTQLGKEVTKEGDLYFRTIFLKEKWKYLEMGKVYFDAKWNFDAKKTTTKQEIKIVWVSVGIEIDSDKNTFTITNVDNLKEKIKKHRDILSTYIENSEFGDNTIFTGFNREKGGKRKQSKLLWLEIINDMYTFKRKWEKTTETINIGFTDMDELFLRDNTGKKAEPIIIEIQRANGKKEIREIQTNTEKKQFIIQQTESKLVTNQEKPALENEPNKLMSKNYIYHQNSESKKIEYYNGQGTLITSIPATKTEKNEWKLWTLTEDVNTNDLYKEMIKTIANKSITEKLKNINLLDNDLYTAFDTMIKKSKATLTWRNVVKVMDDEKNNIYKYYKIEQTNDGDPFIFIEDEELYEEAKKVMEILLENMSIIEKIENTQLWYKDKKEKVEKKFTQFVGWCWFLPIPTQNKIDFLWETEKTKTSLTKKFIWGSKTADIQEFDIIFEIKGSDITTAENTQTINRQKYKTRLKEKEEWLTLRFDDIE